MKHDGFWGYSILHKDNKKVDTSTLAASLPQAE
jgi:hypothetical protein